MGKFKQIYIKIQLAALHKNTVLANGNEALNKNTVLANGNEVAIIGSLMIIIVNGSSIDNWK